MPYYKNQMAAFSMFYFCTDSQGNTPTLRHNLQMNPVFSESDRSEAVGMTRDVLDKCVN